MNMKSNLIKNILVPFDGSKFSKRALDTAIELSEKEFSKIHLISVVNVDYIPPPGSLMGIVSASSVNAIKRLAASAKKETEGMLMTHAKKCNKAGIKTNFKAIKGNVSEEILNYSKKNKITLMVIGSQGLHGISKLKVLGSTSRRVSELASCPVMIVR